MTELHRTALAAVMLAHLAVILPFAWYLPAWVLLPAPLVMLWRWQVWRGAWGWPGRWVKVGLMLLAVAGLQFSYGRWLGLEPMVALLVIAASLKLLELHRQRDGIVMAALHYLLLLSLFLFNQSIPLALGLLLLVMVVTGALVAQQRAASTPLLTSIGLGAKLVAQALPLMAVLFVMMPRMGALWTVPVQQHAARTGVSDQMSPGDVSQLSRSGATAFRVSFDGPVPPSQLRYWRGLVLTYFDGRRWSQAEARLLGTRTPVAWPGRNPQWLDQAQWRGQPLTYEVIMEPTHQPWLFAMPLAQSASEGVGLTRDWRLVRREPVGRRWGYQVTSYPQAQYDPGELDPWLRRLSLQLPAGGNPQARALAEQWREQGLDDRAVVAAALALYNRRFTYTLQPPTLGANSVDEFLFQTQRGFCEHFAGSFVFLLRAAGVPARVVLGYQGGELHPDGDYLIVRQYDAHAWAEVWYPETGWTRVDPTAAVAPARIEQGGDYLAAEEEAFLADSPFSMVRFRHLSWVNRWLMQWDQMNYLWARWVLGFDRQEQQDLLSRWLGGLDPWRLALGLLVSAGSALGLLWLWLWWRGRPPTPPPALRWYQRYRRRLARAGYAPRPEEGPRTLGQRVIRSQPALAPAVNRLTRLFEQALFGQRPVPSATLARAVRRFRPPPPDSESS